MEKNNQPLLKAVGKPAKWVKTKCHCGNKMKYACVIQCEPCWQKVVEDCHERKAKAKAAEEARWAPAAGSAAAAVAAATPSAPAPVLATPEGAIKEIERVQSKLCACGKVILNTRFTSCYRCNQERRAESKLAEAQAAKIEKLKQEVAQRQRELAQLQLKQADEAFEATQQALDDGTLREDESSAD